MKEMFKCLVAVGTWAGLRSKCAFAFQCRRLLCWKNATASAWICMMASFIHLWGGVGLEGAKLTLNEYAGGAKERIHQAMMG